MRTLLDNMVYRAMLENLNDGEYFIDLQNNILFWNKGAERISGYTASEVEGLHCDGTLLRHIDESGNVACENFCPKKHIIEYESYEMSLFLLHKQGYRVPVQLKTSMIKNSLGNAIGAMVLMRDNSEQISTQKMLDNLQNLALRDELTGVANRRFLESSLNAHLMQMRTAGIGFAVVFIDIDNFKEINDLYGHNAGDGVLITLAKTLSANLRSQDIFGRWGGDEFLAIIFDVKNDFVVKLCERIRFLSKTSEYNFSTKNGETKKVSFTVSIGGTFATHEDTAISVVSRADNLMYHSKTLGRDTFTCDF